MHFSTAAAAAALLAPSALALPFNTMRLAARQMAPSEEINADFPIHESCNGSQTMQLKKGFADMKIFAQTAVDHLLLHGHNSAHSKLYFGENTDITPALGYYERLLNADKTPTLFRCDDPDGNCALPGYGGHWRGENATNEIVICDLSFQNRLPIEKVCSNGFQLGTDKVNQYWGTDLIHRVFHLPHITDEGVGHVADTFAAAIELAKTSPNETVSNQNTLQFFAFDLFSRTIFPNGCIGNIKPDDGHVEGQAAPTNATSSAPAATATASAAAALAPAATSSAPAAALDCHTHADGTQHCV